MEFWVNFKSLLPRPSNMLQEKITDDHQVASVRLPTSEYHAASQKNTTRGVSVNLTTHETLDMQSTCGVKTNKFY